MQGIIVETGGAGRVGEQWVVGAAYLLITAECHHFKDLM
jgi:hypothetical protein